MNNKQTKWKNNRSRIIDALESNAHQNQYESMISNLSLLTVQEFLGNKERLLYIALKHGSKECADFLLSKGSTYNSIQVLRDCQYKKMVEIFNMLEEFDKKYKEEELNRDVSSGENKKLNLINRLIDPSKVEANKERVDFLFKLTSEGFFTIESVKEQIEVHYKEKPEKKNKFVSIYRELVLKELGI